MIFMSGCHKHKDTDTQNLCHYKNAAAAPEILKLFNKTIKTVIFVLVLCVLCDTNFIQHPRVPYKFVSHKCR